MASENSVSQQHLRALPSSGVVQLHVRNMTFELPALGIVVPNTLIHDLAQQKDHNVNQVIGILRILEVL